MVDWTTVVDLLNSYHSRPILSDIDNLNWSGVKNKGFNVKCLVNKSHFKAFDIGLRGQGRHF